jgi:NAD(P) transhydrogenase subunit alpha
MIKLMPAGSIIVDLAAEQGGNCEGVEPGKTIQKNEVTIVGAVNLAAAVPVDASQMYSRNVVNLFRHLYPKPEGSPDFSDEIVKGACLTRNREIVNEALRQAFHAS